jgi:hypothetical protein
MTDCEELYKIECKHYGYGDQCYKKSGYSGKFHITMGCDGNCARMKRYRRIKAQENKTPEEVKRALLKELADLEE